MAESLLKKGFVEQVALLRDFLRALKEEFDGYDIRLAGEREKEVALNSRKREVFEKLDVYFEVLWSDFSSLPKGLFEQHKAYFERQMMPYLAENIETNTYIREKSLGYAGDYVMMNLIYDYHQRKFLGKTLYAKLINHYTCNIDVAQSNIQRKEYLKSKLLEFMADGNRPQILSVGCGPAREVTELLREGKLNGHVTIHLLDIEKNAVDFVAGELKRIDFDRSKIKINLYLLDLIEIIKNKRVAALFKEIDLVYISGVFDYLSDRLSERVLRGMFNITKKELIVFNMSFENARHRAYYEIFGEWVMRHRKKEDLLKWTESLSGNYRAQIENCPKCKSYWVLKVEKK